MNDCTNCWYKSPKNSSGKSRFPCENCKDFDLWEKVWEDEDLIKKVEELYQRMFVKRYSGDYLTTYDHAERFFGGGNSWKYKNRIKELLLAGKKVTTGYTCSSMVRQMHEHQIFWKD